MIVVSGCLAGIKCRYDGEANAVPEVLALVNAGKAIPVCPEQLGGLTTPRVSAEQRIIDGKTRVVRKDGVDVTAEFEKGAERTLAIARAVGATKAVLKARSPSCGCGEIYDGTFTGCVVPGNGMTAALLLEAGMEVVTEKGVINGG